MAMLTNREALQHTLQLIEPELGNFVPPQGAFDPAGSWTHVYRIAAVKQSRSPSPRELGGQVTIHRYGQPNGPLLEVKQQMITKGYASWSNATIECGDDQLSTPRRWTVESWTCSPDKKEEAESRLKFAAEPARGEIRFSGICKPPLRVAADWTLDWALLDALQRLPQDCGDLSFDLVEDYDLLRPRQRLSSTGPVTAKLGGKETELYGFCHIGSGTLPTHYWLDRQQRLLFVLHYYRVFVLQVNTEEGKK